MKYVFPAMLLAVAGVAGAVLAEEQIDLENQAARTSYSLGYQIGGDFRRQEVEMEAEAVVQGMRDALAGAEPKIPVAEMNATLVELKQTIVADQRKRSVERELERLAEGKAFLEENAKKEGVVTTASGLQYKILEGGTGKSPGPEDQVTVHYRGTLVDGKEFDSSYQRGEPASFNLKGVIKGWSEGLQLMKEGGRAELYIPETLAYGDRGPLAHRALIFDVELISVGAQEDAQVPAETPEGGQE